MELCPGDRRQLELPTAEKVIDARHPGLGRTHPCWHPKSGQIGLGVYGTLFSYRVSRLPGERSGAWMLFCIFLELFAVKAIAFVIGIAAEGLADTCTEVLLGDLVQPSPAKMAQSFQVISPYP